MKLKRRIHARPRTLRQLLLVAATALFLLTTGGCLPEAPPLDGMLSFREANELLFEEHANHGAIYNIDHVWNGKPFKAEWRLANFLKKSAQLQIKPPTETFDEVDLCMALEIALADESSNPWHNIADDAIIAGFRGALQNEDTHLASAYCPDAPYDITVKVKNNGSEWFCEVIVQNLMDPKKLEEAQKYAQDQLDRLEKQHAND